MISRGAELLFEVVRKDGDAGARLRCEVLHGGTEQEARIRFLDEPPALWPGLEARVYFRRDEEFVRCAAVVEGVSPDQEECEVRMQGPLEPVPGRECYRVRTDEDDLWCSLAEEQCRIVSLSAGGLGVVSSRTHAHDDLLEVVFYHEGESTPGRVRVASAQEQGPGSVLYGLKLAPAVSGTGPSLGDVLSRLCMRLQLEQLRRRTR